MPGDSEILRAPTTARDVPSASFSETTKRVNRFETTAVRNQCRGAFVALKKRGVTACPRSVNPDFVQQRQRSRRLQHEALGMCGIGCG